MSVLRLRWQDISGLKRVENAVGMLSSEQKDNAFRRAVNHTGDKARTVVIRTLAEQTGLKQKVIRKAVKVKRANFSSLEYVMTTRGGDISLKFFAARETRPGVSAAPFGERRVFPGTFMKGGRFPNRVTAKGLNGHVYRRTGSGRGPLEMVDSGVIIPAEMVRGATASAFTGLVERELPPRVMHEIMRQASSDRPSGLVAGAPHPPPG
jgi:hypothetical protein